MLLEVEALTTAYRGLIAVSDVSIAVAEGEIVVVAGANGAGKSTLLKSLFGLIPIREGKVLLRGEDITSMKAHDLVSRGIGYVPQINNVFPSLTVRENLEMGGYLRRGSVDGRIAFVIEMFPRLGERIDLRAGSLSGGERQMLAMGRAMMMEPSVLLLDEPSAGLSPIAAQSLFEQIKTINREGVSIALVEQNATEALAVSDRAYILLDGRNSRTGNARELAADPEIKRIFLGG